MDMTEYLAMLVTPHPKQALKVIADRKKILQASKLKSGQIDKDQIKKKLFTEDHRSTTFYDEIAKHGGEQAAKDAAIAFEDDLSEVQSYEERDMDIEDYEFIQKVKQIKSDIDNEKKEKEKIKRSYDVLEM